MPLTETHHGVLSMLKNWIPFTLKKTKLEVATDATARPSGRVIPQWTVSEARRQASNRKR